MNKLFSIEYKDQKSKARAGILKLSHQDILTPVFMPVGTVGSVKNVSQQQLKNIDFQIILGNTYHLYLRPTTEVLHQAQGLHHFINWDRNILTDSGGYQVFSLASNRTIKEEGVFFKSHIDGSKHLFTPEKVVEIQRIIGSNVMMAFDECTPFPCHYAYAQQSMERTHRWLERGWKNFNNTENLYAHQQYFFPIIQGSVFEDLRKISCQTIDSYPSTGIAIGGLSVGEPESQMYEFCDLCVQYTSREKPIYLMGVGTPWNLLEAIALGIDMFDCVMPTRNARNAHLFTSQGTINMRNEKWKYDHSPIDENTPNEISQYYSKSYLRHLFVSGELLALQIASIHNLAFYKNLMLEARKKIIEGSFLDWKNQLIPILKKRL
ncbi:MAG: tRNA guanosine(34) transglycosylase Tgt [Chitinophagaceae bacterium]